MNDKPVKLQLRMTETQSLDNLPVSIGQLTVHVLNTNGQPAVGARVLVRDAEARPGSEHWGTTNLQGNTTLELTLIRRCCWSCIVIDYTHFLPMAMRRSGRYD